MDEPHTFKIMFTPDNLLMVERSSIVKRYEVQGKFIAVWLIDIQTDFIKSGSLTINYLKKVILSPFKGR